MLRTHSRTLIRLAVIPMTLILLAGCGETDLTSSLESLPPETSEARVLINDEAASGQISVPSGIAITQGHGRSQSRMKLTARFQQAAGGAPIQEGYCDYSHQRQQTMGGMMQHRGQFRLWDDGTHGDQTPGDGIYCNEGLFSDMMRFTGMPMHNMDETIGDHEGEFYCVDEGGRESNRVTVRFEVK